MAEVTVKIKGMTCGHCAQAVTEELSNLPGVTEVTVDLNPGETAVSQATVESTDSVSDNALNDAISEAGYELVEIIRN